MSPPSGSGAAPALILASASPRRAQLLAQIGVSYHAVPAALDERREPGEPIERCVLRLAEQKALQVRCARRTSLPVLGADTAVLLDEEMLGKPADRAAALSMLARLSGRSHRVLTAVALAGADGVRSLLSQSEVRLRRLSATECAAYWDSGEPRDKAGAYAIQGLGAVFVEELHGSYSGVVGLPLFETATLLAEAGVPLWQPVRTRPGRGAAAHRPAPDRRPIRRRE
ncbi:MAG TPA: Maf family protein [Steroidobacteraceae bacterium]|nr:Maf family protein [Steroidobacteraceae bacterium]